jgi:hypothetical protein
MREFGGQNEKRNYFNNTVMLSVVKDEQNLKIFYYRLNSLWHLSFNIA